MKNKLMLLMVTGVVALVANAADGPFEEVVDGVTWRFMTFMSDGRTCANVQSGSEKYAGDLKIPSTLGGYPVTRIGNYAFNHCDGLTSVTIPAGVTRIGVSAFSGCSGLKSVMVPPSVTEIAGLAFYNCRGLADEKGFIVVAGILFGYFGEASSVVIPSNVTNVGHYALKDCKGLISLTIPSSVKSIERGAFSFCSALTSVVISPGVLSLADGAFAQCSSLASVTLPPGLLSIGDSAFRNCDALASVTIPETVTNVGSRAFAYCGKLATATAGSNILQMGEDAFSNTPLMQVDGDKREIAYLGNCALGFKTCLIDGVRRMAADDFYGDNENVQKIDIVLKEGTSCIADNAFYSIRFKTKGGLSSEYTIPYGRVVLPDGLRTIGAGAFSSTFYPGSHRGLDLAVPASVVWLGDGSLSGIVDRRICFSGPRPQTDGMPFSKDHSYGGEDVSAVYYADGAGGWKWGETWSNVRTYSVESVPSEYRVASAVRFAGGPHKGYRFRGQMKGCPCKQDDYELDGEDPKADLRAGGDFGTYRTTDGMFFALPVVGARSKSEVSPFIQLLTAKQDMIASVEVWSDVEMWNALTEAVTEDWESDDDELCERYYDDWASMTFYYRGWDKSLWPAGRSVAGRHWVFVKLNDLKYLNSSEWGGDYTFRVGLEGTSEWSRTLHVSFENTSALNALASTRGLTVRDVTHVSVDAELHNGGGDPFSFSEYDLQSGAFPLSFRIDLPEPGTLYLYGSDVPGEDDSVAARDLEITGSYKGLDREIYLDGYSSENNPWWPTTNFCAYAGACVIRAVDVSRATTLQLRGKHPQSCEVDLVRLQFFPAGKKSVAIEATSGDLAAWSLSDGDVDYDAMIYGRVTGTGVYSSGEYVHLVAEPVAGESFDHWEVVLGSLPSNLDLRKQVLDFTMPADICGSAAERKQIVVRPVWKKRNAVTALPNVQGRGTVTGSGKYLAGTQVTLTATPASEYVFASWSDGKTSATRTLRVEDVDLEVEHVLYACFCRPEELGYTIIFKSEGSSDIKQSYTHGTVFALPKGLFPVADRRFAGWVCSNGRCYDDGVLVFDLAEPGETVTMTAVWE